MRHPERSLKQIGERMVFDHLIHLRDKEKLGPSTLNQAVVALRMFYRDYLERDWQLWEQFEIRRDQPLPMVLTRDEVHQLMGAVRENRFKAVLALIYHCGLRVGEAVRLRPKDIDSKRGMLRVIDGKGGRNREVPVAPQMIERLRGYWCFHRNAHWLFPGVGRGWKERSTHLAGCHGGCHRADERLQCSGSAACGGARSANQKECHLSYLAAQLRDPPVGRRGVYPAGEHVSRAQ
jgi:integrase